MSKTTPKKIKLPFFSAAPPTTRVSSIDFACARRNGGFSLNISKTQTSSVVCASVSVWVWARKSPTLETRFPLSPSFAHVLYDGWREKNNSKKEGKLFGWGKLFKRFYVFHQRCAEKQDCFFCPPHTVLIGQIYDLIVPCAKFTYLLRRWSRCRPSGKDTEAKKKKRKKR